MTLPCHHVMISLIKQQGMTDHLALLMILTMTHIMRAATPKKAPKNKISAIPMMIGYYFFWLNKYRKANNPPMITKPSITKNALPGISNRKFMLHLFIF